VDFELTPDQEALQEGVRKLLQGRAGRAQVRAAAELAGAVDRGLWADLAEAGVFSLRLPEADDGAGLGLAEAVLVFEELGRALVPGPLIGSHLAASSAVVGVLERPGKGGPGGAVVEHLAALDALMVLDGEGVWRVEPGAIEGAAVPRPLDPLTPLHAVSSLPLPSGEPVGGPDMAARWRVEGAVLAAALLLGNAVATLELAVAYAKERHQFDRPIGSFQAVKHILADMLVRSEVARAAVYAAGVTVDDPAVGDPARAAAVAKLQAGRAAIANGKACIQVFGGMGFTWEVDAHLYLKRAWVLDTVFGSADSHALSLL
jgi:alkylation response protein AidB-like acyl-CoA dehydrogenase